MTLKIRPITADDRAGWRRLWTDYLAFYNTGVTEDVYQITFSRLLDKNAPQQCGFIAERDGAAVGLVHYIFHPHNWRVEDVCYLQDLYVDPAVRGTGVGRALIEKVYEAADAKGSPSVYWLTQDFNADARKLYDRVAHLTPFIKYQR